MGRERKDINLTREMEALNQAPVSRVNLNSQAEEYIKPAQPSNSNFFPNQDNFRKEDVSQINSEVNKKSRKVKNHTSKEHHPLNVRKGLSIFWRCVLLLVTLAAFTYLIFVIVSMF